MVLHLRIRMEHVRYRRNVPGVPPRVEIDPVPFVRPVVAPFGLVRAMIKFRLVPSALEQIPKELVTSVQFRN